jgi:hypothetical protein
MWNGMKRYECTKVLIHCAQFCPAVLYRDCSIIYSKPPRFLINIRLAIPLTLLPASLHLIITCCCCLRISKRHKRSRGVARGQTEVFYLGGLALKPWNVSDQNGQGYYSHSFTLRSSFSDDVMCATHTHTHTHRKQLKM